MKRRAVHPSNDRQINLSLCESNALRQPFVGGLDVREQFHRHPPVLRDGGSEDADRKRRLLQMHEGYFSPDRPYSCQRSATWNLSLSGIVPLR